MTYTEALNYIHSVSWRGSVPGLSRIQALCDAIAGTVVYLLLRRNKTLQQRLEEPEDL